MTDCVKDPKLIGRLYLLREYSVFIILLIVVTKLIFLIKRFHGFSIFYQEFHPILVGFEILH